MVSIIKMLERSRKKSARNEQSNKKFDRFIKFLRHLIKFLYQHRFDLVVRSWNLSRIGIFGKSKSSRASCLFSFSCFSNSLLLCFLLFPAYLIPRRGFDFSPEFTRFFTPFSSFIDEPAGFSEKQEHRFRFIFLRACFEEQGGGIFSSQRSRNRISNIRNSAGNCGKQT